jgi:hypothetical protein
MLFSLKSLFHQKSLHNISSGTNKVGPNCLKLQTLINDLARRPFCGNKQLLEKIINTATASFEENPVFAILGLQHAETGFPDKWSKIIRDKKLFMIARLKNLNQELALGVCLKLLEKYYEEDPAAAFLYQKPLFQKALLLTMNNGVPPWKALNASVLLSKHITQDRLLVFSNILKLAETVFQDKAVSTTDKQQTYLFVRYVYDVPILLFEAKEKARQLLDAYAAYRPPPDRSWDPRNNRRLLLSHDLDGG